MSRENASFITASGNAGITFETQGRCENEACVDFGGEFAQRSGSTLPTERSEGMIRDVDASGHWLGKTVTRISQEGVFWESGPADQDYLQRYPNVFRPPFPCQDDTSENLLLLVHLEAGSSPPRWRGHFVRVRQTTDLDDELRSWLQESHDTVGLQIDLSKPPE